MAIPNQSTVVTEDQSADEHSARTVYERRLETLQQQRLGLAGVNGQLSVWRGVTFLPALFGGIYTWLGGITASIGYPVAGLLFGVFLWLTQKHERVRSRMRSTDERIRINEHHVLRVQRDFSSLPDPTPRAEDVDDETRNLLDSATAYDLDLFGANSILQWLCLAHTPMGRRRLVEWLMRPAIPEEIKRRQAAAIQLAPNVSLREELQMRGRLLRRSKNGPDAFLAWAESDSWLNQRPWVLWLARVCALLAIAGMLGLGLGVVPLAFRPHVLVALVVIAAINLIVNVINVPTIHRLFDRLASRQNEVVQYQSMFQLMDDLPDDCEAFTRIKASMNASGANPLLCLAQLSRRVAAASSRRSAIWGVPYLLGQLFLQMDVHVLNYLEGWQTEYGKYARQWFEGLAELEALASLSAVAHDHPTWCFPQVESELTEFVATALGHPLIPDDARVANDVKIGPQGRFLLVTGSNMSGKVRSCEVWV